MKSLVLAKLSDHQILKAKELNGAQKRITHILICADYGQLLGTEAQCSKYYNVWKDIFKDLFSSSSRSDHVNDISNYKATENLVNVLIALQDELPTSGKNKLKAMLNEAGLQDDFNELDTKKESWLKKIFR